MLRLKKKKNQTEDVIVEDYRLNLNAQIRFVTNAIYTYFRTSYSLDLNY